MSPDADWLRDNTEWFAERFAEYGINLYPYDAATEQQVRSLYEGTGKLIAYLLALDNGEDHVQWLNLEAAIDEGPQQSVDVLAERFERYRRGVDMSGWTRSTVYEGSYQYVAGYEIPDMSFLSGPDDSAPAD